MLVMRNAYVAVLILPGTNAHNLATSDVLSEDSFISDGGMTHLKEVPHHLRGGSPSCPVLSNYPENDGEIETFLDAFKPCGHYANLGCPYEVILANVDYPGSGPGELEFIPYITQFDVGLHQTVSELIREQASDDQMDKFIGTPNEGETCVEAIVQANNSRFDATLGGCAGKCGSGCGLFSAGWAKDCLKHDICVTYKNFMLNPTLTSSNVKDNQPNGFCDDLDCGDEAAQTVMNCFSERRWGWDENIVCDEQVFEVNPKAFGKWNLAMHFAGGKCYNYESWARGQGVPNDSQIRNSEEFIDHLKSKSVKNDSVVRSK